MKSHRAAALAGIIFSILLIVCMLLIRSSTPANPLAAATDFMRHSRRISLALALLPFAGISFLWFVGVLRDRLGKHEDRFFSTVVFGSALLFLAMIFIAGTIAGGIISFAGRDFEHLVESGAYTLGRIEIYQVMHMYAIKMAGVFMISTSTIAVKTGIIPRWMSYLGFVLALMLLLIFERIDWILLVFPVWVLMISVYFLIENFRGAPEAAAMPAVGRE